MRKTLHDTSANKLRQSAWDSKRLAASNNKTALVPTGRARAAYRWACYWPYPSCPVTGGVIPNFGLYGTAGAINVTSIARLADNGARRFCTASFWRNMHVGHI